MRLIAALIIAIALPQAVLASESIPSGAQFNVGFSPRRGALEVVRKGIQAAKSQILVAAYSFTSKPIAQELLMAHKRGVAVFVVADKADSEKGYSATRFLANQGIPVRVNGNYAILHHKFMIFDGQHVELGSFNYSAAAVDKNAENALLLWNVKPIAGAYSSEWKRLWDESTTMQPAY
jgi:phosphatidylserine/phosphatidylglycerophosphate/cardiolipin synthase-like enzyme